MKSRLTRHIGRLAALLATAALSPLATGQTIPDVAPEIVSAWKAVGENALLIFRYDGTYHMAQDSAGALGMERGTFIWNKATSAFSANTVVDTNGDAGLSHPGGATTLTITGNTMTYTIADGGSLTLTRVVNTASAIVGSWFAPGEKSTVTFLADGTYFHTEETNDAPYGYDGMERGNYTWNPSTHILTASPTTDTNGDVGLSSLPPGFTATISGNTLTAFDGSEMTILKRITTNATPFSKLLGDFHVEKFANYFQSTDAAPSPVNNPVAGDYPFWGEAYVQAYVGAIAPTLKIGTRTPESFVSDEDTGEFGIEYDQYPTKAALDAATAFPDGTTYEFKSGSDTATLTFPASVAFPAVPKLLLGTGAWNSGSYDIDVDGTLSWTGQNPFDSSKHATLLSIEDVTENPSVDLLKEFVIQGDVTCYDLTGKLTPGHDYWVSIEHLKIGSSTTSGTGVFAGRQGHAFHNTNTSFLLKATAAPASAPVITLQPVSQLAESGDDIILAVTTDGSPKPVYQWFKDGVALPGQTGNSLSLFNFDISNRGAYTVTATNSEGADESSVAWLSGPPVVEFVVVSKGIEYVQTGPSAVVVSPQPVSEYYGGPYGFSATVVGQNMYLLDAPTITPPAGTPNTLEDPFYSTLFLEQGNQPDWRYGPNANDWGDTTQAGIDTRFPNGTYTFSVDGVSVPLNLTGNAYPNTPQLTLSGGTWVNGKYAMDASNALAVTTNVFTGYGSNVDGVIDLWVNDSGVRLFKSTSPTTNSASYTAPANTLPTDWITYIDADFAAVVSQNNTLPGVYAAAYYGKSVKVEVHILPKIIAQTSSQALNSGASIDLEVTATGTPADGTGELGYQWKKDGIDLPGMMLSSFGLLNFAAENAGTYTCTVSNDVGSVTSAPIYLEFADDFQAYVAGFGLNSVTTGAPDADFDKDGIPNLLEYLFGGNPTLPGSGLLPAITKAPGGSNLVFTYKRKIAASGVTQVIEHATSLSPPWTAAVHGQNGVIIATTPVPGDATAEQVTVTIPSTSASRFVRLKASR